MRKGERDNEEDKEIRTKGGIKEREKERKRKRGREASSEVKEGRGREE